MDEYAEKSTGAVSDGGTKDRTLQSQGVLPKGHVCETTGSGNRNLDVDVRTDLGTSEEYLASCSFYDHSLHIWTYTH